MLPQGLILASAVAAFDLTCTGQRVETDRYATPPKLSESSSYVSRLRIDPVSMQWCSDKCIIVMPLVSSDAARVVLSDIHREGNSAVGQIDLPRSHMSAVMRESRGPERLAAVTTWEGECVRSAFSGFPQR